MRLCVTLPQSWRGPAFVFLVTRPWRFIGAIVLASAIGLALSGAVLLERAVQIFWFFGLSLSLALSKGVISGDRAPERWYVLFQRPGGTTSHYFRCLVIAACVMIAGLLLPWIALGVTGARSGMPTSVIVGFIVGSLIWSTAILLTGFAMSSLLRASDTEAVILLLLLTLVQAVLVRTFHLPNAVARVLEAFLFPFFGLSAVWRHLIGGPNEVTRWQTVHLAVFPLALLALIAYRVRRLSRLDISKVF